ncbi:MAG: hypothetical protein K2M48_01185 [Clostridiales bacterium]|nr:hypothetical protein [Clostridiales bacterium]
MTSTEETRARIVATDGGTGKHEYPDFKSAYKSVSPTGKRRAFIMLGCAGACIAFVLLTRLLWLLAPVYDLALYGMLSKPIYYVLLGLLCTAFIVGLNIFVKKFCGVRLFAARERAIDIPRAFAIIAVGAATVFIVSATFGFTLKIQKEMGMGITIATALTNISVYFYYAFHLWIGFAAAALVQQALSMLLPAKHTVPWGAIFLVTVFGLLELIFEYATTSHPYPLYYYFMTYAYAAIYVISGRSFHVSFWASVIILVL